MNARDLTDAERADLKAFCVEHRSRPRKEVRTVGELLAALEGLRRDLPLFVLRSGSVWTSPVRLTLPFGWDKDVREPCLHIDSSIDDEGAA